MNEAQWQTTGCGSCFYLGWDGVLPWCRHPDHGRLITGPGCRGRNHVDRYKKLLPTAQPDYPAPLPLPERN
ncbi:MAG: hypothetical protein JXR59_04010 [Desulfuromonadaceae bacterium]|nr:hypothetical protein [Desulfuromonadaceae bacterium]